MVHYMPAKMLHLLSIILPLLGQRTIRDDILLRRVWKCCLSNRSAVLLVLLCFYLTMSNIWRQFHYLHMVLTQAKWYYYILLGLVDVEANFLGKCFIVVEILYYIESIGKINIFICSSSNNSWSKQNKNLLTNLFPNLFIQI